jgi:hypothetical protein
LAWKFDRLNNPYFNKARWHHPYVAVDIEPARGFDARARLLVQSYLDALVAGNLGSALRHLGMPADGNTNALAELPIIRRSSSISIVSTRRGGDQEQVEADILSSGREYFEVFHVAHDGPAVRIVDRFYIPVNHSAQVAAHFIHK